MFCCKMFCCKKRMTIDYEEPRNKLLNNNNNANNNNTSEGTKPVKGLTVKYEKIIGELSDTSCENIPPPVPPRNVSQRNSQEVNQVEIFKNENNNDDNESLFNISINHSILSGSLNKLNGSGSGSIRSGEIHILGDAGDTESGTSEEKNEIEPLFTLNITIKNERNGVLIHRKVYL